jgi:signal transduction histidine kinase
MMDIEVAINLVDKLVYQETSQHLNSVQINLLRGVWFNQSYEEIAEICYCSVSHVKMIGSAFWKQLSQILGERATKKTLRAILESYYQDKKIGKLREGRTKFSANKSFRQINKKQINQIPEKASCWFDCDFLLQLTDRLDYCLETISNSSDVDLSQLKNLTQKLRLIHNLTLPNYSFKPTSLDIISICRNLINNLKLNFPNRQIMLSVFEEPILPDYDLSINILIDKKLIENILKYLLINALQYSELKTLVTLDIDIEEQKGIFTVIDEGIGIPNKELEQSFQAFYRATNVHKNSGDGLGLFIVQKSVRLHQGKILVASDVKSGSVFQVVLPVV